MAEIVWAMASDEGREQQFEPEFYLYNAFGFSNFQSAITEAIAAQVDLILYAEVWEYGGNFDGQGFFNTEVDRAIDAGILWVNAAGNFGRSTYNSGIQTIADNWVKLPDQNQSLLIRCEHKTECDVRVVLSWNDFKNSIEPGTDKDLDLALADDLLNIVQSSSLKQSSDPAESRPGYSKYPREIVTAKLKPGNYYIRAKNRSGNFSSADRLRISVTGDFVSMPSYDRLESLLTPADNPRAIVVGASDSDRSSSSVLMGKPDLLSPSRLLLQDSDLEYRGSSNSAAMVAAGLAVMLSQQQHLTQEQFLSRARHSTDWSRGGISLSLLGFVFTGWNCFQEARYPNLPGYLQSVLNAGGVLVQTNNGARIMLPFDPLQLAPQLRRQTLNDLILITPEGFKVVPRGNSAWIPREWIEVFQRPLEAGLCQPPTNSGSNKNFRMPN
jgi:hypothetical protein